MSNNYNSKLLMAFLAGAAVGAAVGYYLNSDKKNELVEDLKDGAASLKKVFDNSFGKINDIVDVFTEVDFESENDVPAKS